MWKLLANETNIPWEKVHIFMADERVVRPTHKDSNYKLAYDTFLKSLIACGKLPKKNVHPFTPKKSKDKGSNNYYNELKKLGGKPDILILGVGEDGHVGALFPNNHSIKNNAQGYIIIDDSPKPPSDRITMSRRTMLTAKTAILLFIGENKREAYKKFLAGNKVVECPARLAKQIKRSYVLTTIRN